MKRLLLLALPVFVLITFIACDDDDSMVPLPQEVLDYISANYGGYDIDESEEDVLCDGTAVYEVELEKNDDDEKELVFDQEGNFLFEEIEIPTNQLPDAVSTGVASNYPGSNLKEVERLDYFDGSTRYEVEIDTNNGKLDVMLDADGTVICDEPADGDDD